MKSEEILSGLAKYRLPLFVSQLICTCTFMILGAVIVLKGQSGKVFEIPGSELVFRLDKANGGHRSLSVYRSGHVDAPGENRIRMIEDVPWRSMITVSTYSPDTVFVCSDIDIVSTKNVRIEYDSPAVNIRAEGDSRYVRCWFAPKANKMFMATDEENYSEIKPDGSESKKRNVVERIFYIFVALAAICALLLRLIEDQTEAMPEDLAPNGKRMIRVDNMRRGLLDMTLKDFMNLYRLKGIVESIEGTESRFVLKISSSVDFFTFSLLINYLTYSEKNRRYAVTGWYEVGTYRTDNKKYAFSHKTLMFYIPESDDEYDNVYFVTPEGVHFKQSFGNPAILRVLNSETRKYEAL